ncbi:probable periplasmic serine endoprotease DegP-like [Triticum dicoccoides]|uniref:probable periplasmic serine endoprotease DegP-like isoform X1 n=1 Tax=Triticum aestivum TaxID=4565 RepID=UPI000842A8C7|nr:probable periplasmic serine endoprotease DegP-like [Triticum dicoccoides]XP_044394115.1 probable periplasmic serine endoprotease DegP-like isoform X1 [Triticum aestivum]
MPKDGRRRRRGNPETETEARKKRKTKRSVAEDRRLIFAAFESEKAKPRPKLDPVYDDDDDAVESSSEESSSCPPSPLMYRPYIPDELADDPDLRAALRIANTEYHADRACRLAVFDRYSSSSCLSNDRRLLHIREHAKDAVLLAADSIITLSSYLEADDDEPLNTCCGLWIQHDMKKKTAVVLTSAHLIRAKDPSVRNPWMLGSTCEYHRDAEVIVHLLDGETAVATLLYLEEHYEFALYEVVVDKPVQLPTFNDNVHSGQDVFRLGRDESLDLRITHGRVEYEIPTRHERCHYMYFSHDERTSLHDDGGPVVDLEGKVVGMVHNQFKETFLPSSILHKCLDSWRKLKCIPRAHLGMTFTSIKLLDPICIERMRRKHNIASGLLVEQVSKESNAEKLGIRMGDVIERFNGECISNTTELEKMLLDIGGDHFDQAKVLKAETDVRIQIFHATKRCRRVRNLTVTVSDCGEDIIEGTYPITDGLWR